MTFTNPCDSCYWMGFLGFTVSRESWEFIGRYLGSNSRIFDMGVSRNGVAIWRGRMMSNQWTRQWCMASIGPYSACSSIENWELLGIQWDWPVNIWEHYIHGIWWNRTWQHDINIYPICSMYGIFANICPKNHPNVVKYTIHGVYGYIYWLMWLVVWPQNCRNSKGWWGMTKPDRDSGEASFRMTKPFGYDKIMGNLSGSCRIAKILKKNRKGSSSNMIFSYITRQTHGIYCSGLWWFYDDCMDMLDRFCIVWELCMDMSCCMDSMIL